MCQSVGNKNDANECKYGPIDEEPWVSSFQTSVLRLPAPGEDAEVEGRVTADIVLNFGSELEMAFVQYSETPVEEDDMLCPRSPEGGYISR